MSDSPPIPEPLWRSVPPEAQAAVRARLGSLERRVAESERRLDTNSASSSRPSSADPPSAKRRPPALASGR
ncbi:DUF6444 domain-containing protein [Tautonia plasticadhaerens]|uniref:DUF6444 domain-containing protein n=1 Tax=Tautonia plasticadhaerens TaxID=2527974 RepID=UPI0036F3BE2E